MKEKIGILGSGAVGKALAKGFIKNGYEVMIGSGSEEKRKALQEEIGPSVKTGNFRETGEFGQILILAVKGSGALQVLQTVAAANLEEKIVIDTTNPIADAPPVNGVLQFFTNINHSLMEQLQQAFPKAKLVKAFSCVGNSLMVNPELPGGKPSMFIAGNDTQAKRKVTEILDLFGWEIEDMGTAEAARAIEPLCILWCIPGFASNQWTHAFKLLKR